MLPDISCTAKQRHTLELFSRHLCWSFLWTWPLHMIFVVEHSACCKLRRDKCVLRLMMLLFICAVLFVWSSGNCIMYIRYSSQYRRNLTLLWWKNPMSFIVHFRLTNLGTYGNDGNTLYPHRSPYLAHWKLNTGVNHHIHETGEGVMSVQASYSWRKCGKNASGEFRSSQVAVCGTSSWSSRPTWAGTCVKRSFFAILFSGLGSDVPKDRVNRKRTLYYMQVQCDCWHSYSQQRQEHTGTRRKQKKTMQLRNATIAILAIKCRTLAMNAHLL